MQAVADSFRMKPGPLPNWLGLDAVEGPSPPSGGRMKNPAGKPRRPPELHPPIVLSEGAVEDQGEEASPQVPDGSEEKFTFKLEE